MGIRLLGMGVVCLLLLASCQNTPDPVATACGKVFLGEDEATALKANGLDMSNVGSVSEGGPLCDRTESGNPVRYCFANAPNATGAITTVNACWYQECVADADGGVPLADGGMSADCSAYPDLSFAINQNDDPSLDTCCASCCLFFSGGKVAGTLLVSD
jgi:hypothetical protein